MTLYTPTLNDGRQGPSKDSMTLALIWISFQPDPERWTVELSTQQGSSTEDRLAHNQEARGSTPLPAPTSPAKGLKVGPSGCTDMPASVGPKGSAIAAPGPSRPGENF